MKTAMSQKQRDFMLLFLVMLSVAAGNTALQSVLPAIGRSLGLADTLIAVGFSFSSLVWTLTAPLWARRSDRHGRKAMLLTGSWGYVLSLILCGIALSAGITGLISPLAAFIGFVLGRLVYGAFGSAAPPAAQAYIATRTGTAERTEALTMLASAFGLGTILGPALAPFFLLPLIGLAGSAFIFAIVGILVALAVLRLLPDDSPMPGRGGAAASDPSVSAQPSGASVIAATAARKAAKVKLTDPRVRPWLIAALVGGHVQAAIVQTTAFLVIDRLKLPPIEAQPMIGLVLMAGAGASLLAQWGLIPKLRLTPRTLVISGALTAGLGAIATGYANSLHMIAVSFALTALGFGLLRPGFTAGASLAVGPAEQGAVAGQVTSINGAVFVLGPSIGVALYEWIGALPYLLSAGALLLLALYEITRPAHASPRAE